MVDYCPGAESNKMMCGKARYYIHAKGIVKNEEKLNIEFCVRRVVLLDFVKLRRFHSREAIVKISPRLSQGSFLEDIPLIPGLLM